jgi:hypothetical protein
LQRLSGAAHEGDDLLHGILGRPHPSPQRAARAWDETYRRGMLTTGASGVAGISERPQACRVERDRCCGCDLDLHGVIPSTVARICRRALLPASSRSRCASRSMPNHAVRLWESPRAFFWLSTNTAPGATLPPKPNLTRKQAGALVTYFCPDLSCPAARALARSPLSRA